MTKEDFKKLAEKHLFVLEGHAINKEGSKEMQIFGFDALYEQLPIHGVMPSVIYLVTNEDKMTVESAHWKLEDGKKEVDEWAKHQPQFTFMVVETEIH